MLNNLYIFCLDVSPRPQHGDTPHSHKATSVLSHRHCPVVLCRFVGYLYPGLLIEASMFI